MSYFRNLTNSLVMLSQLDSSTSMLPNDAENTMIHVTYTFPVVSEYITTHRLHINITHDFESLIYPITQDKHH